MLSDQQLSLDPGRQWFVLEDLVDSVLADAVEADAGFQLMQSAAWRDFADDIKQSPQLSSAELVDISQSFGRLSNLGVDQFELTLELDLYRPPWWKRLWWFIRGLFGRLPEPQPARYRVADSGKGRGGRIRVRVRASRSHGRWQSESAADVN